LHFKRWIACRIGPVKDAQERAAEKCGGKAWQCPHTPG